MALQPFNLYLAQAIFRLINKKLMAFFDKPSHTTTELTGLLRKVLTFVVTATLICFALMFSLLLFAVIAAVGAVAGGYLWWKTRDLRKQMREQLHEHPPGGVIIEGVIIEGVVIEKRVIENRMLGGRVIEGEVIQKADTRNAE